MNDKLMEFAQQISRTVYIVEMLSEQNEQYRKVLEQLLSATERYDIVQLRITAKELLRRYE